MRKFKFRAWENGEMYYQVRVGGMFDNIPTAPTVWNESVGDWLNLTGQPYTKVMQYTGMKDSDDKDIYEGDIVSYEQRNLEKAFGMDEGDDYINKVRVIQFRDQSFNVPAGFVKHLKVIGNIYENPEILNKLQ